MKSTQFFSAASLNETALKQAEEPSAATHKNPPLSHPWVKGTRDEAPASVFVAKQ